jgi:hypothetical protein
MAEPSQQPRLDMYAQDLLKQSYQAMPISQDVLSQYGQGMAQQVQPPIVENYAPQQASMPQQQFVQQAPQQQQMLEPDPRRLAYNKLIEDRFNELAKQFGGINRLVEMDSVELAKKKAAADIASYWGPPPTPERPLNELERVQLEKERMALEQAKSPDEKLAKKIGIEKSLLDLQTAQQNLQSEQQEAQMKNLDRGIKLQNSMANSARAIGIIDGLMSDPDLSSGVGWKSTMAIIPETKARELKTKIDQIKGDIFLKAYESLKGGGSITEVEGAKAQASMQRLDAALSLDDFKQALNELRGTYLDFSNRAAGGLQGFLPQNTEQGQPQAQGVPQGQPAASNEPMRITSPGAVQFIRDPQTGKLIRQQ